MQNELSSPAARHPRSRFSPVLIVFLVALAARLVVLCQAVSTPEFWPTQGDMKFYSDWARRIAAGTLTDHQAFYGLPGYAYWLAGIYKLTGFQPYVAGALQIVAEAATAALIYQLALAVWGQKPGEGNARRAAWTAALAAAGWVLFVPAQAYSVVLMPTCYLVAAFWFVVWWIVRPRTVRPATWAFFGLGLAMGVVAMMVANILFLVPLVLAAIFLRRAWSPEAAPFSPRARAGACALLLGGVGVGVLPCAYHNYVLAGEPVLLSAHSGINFFLGNNPQATGYPKIPAPLHTDQARLLSDSVSFAEQAAGHPLKRVEVSAFWSGLAKQYIREHPGAWLRLVATKLGNFWNALQYDDLGIIGSFQEDGVLLPGIGFGLVAVLALPGLVLAVRWWPEARWIVAAVALHLASLLTVFVTERYRMASVPGLLLLGSAGIVALGHELARRRWKAVAVYGGAFALALLIVLRPVDAGNVREVNEINLAITDVDQGRLDRAQSRLERVLAVTPDSAEVNFALGNIFQRRGDRDRAKSYYRRTLQLDPGHDRVLNNLGVLALEEKRWDLAARFLRGSLRIDPGDAKTQYLLACALRGSGDVDGARAAIREAERLRPDRTDFQQFERELPAQPAAPAAPLTVQS